jgi:ubiquinone/menaquinone biosynthesis C-methylase UbiE
VTYSDPAAYEKFMGRWSARLAPMFLDFAGIEDGQHILDVGCGTGALTVAALAAGSRINVKAIDPVAEYISFARNAVEDRRAEFQVSSVESLPFPDHEFDATLGLLILQDLADPDRSILEMARVTRPSGRVAACQWDFREGFPMLSLLWEAAAAVAPAEVARRKAAGSVQKEADVDTLADQWKRAGLCDVKTAFLEYPMRFRSFDDFWLPFLAGATPTSAFAAALNRETEGELARVLHAKVCGGRSDIAFDLPARALAVVGVNAVPPAR